MSDADWWAYFWKQFLLQLGFLVPLAALLIALLVGIFLKGK